MSDAEISSANFPDGVLSDPTRLEALHNLNLLDSPPEEPFDRLTRLAAGVLNAPISLVTLVDVRRQFFKSASGLPEPWASRRETPLSHSFCQHVVAEGQPLVVGDARTHRVVRDNLAVRDLGVIAYLGVPLCTTDEKTVGSFCVIDTQPREWSQADIGMMRDLAASVMSEAALRVSREQLEDEVRARTAQLTEANERLKIIEAHQRWLIAELDHRVKNTLARVSAIVNFTHSNAHSMDAFVDTLKGRILSLAGAHELLSRGGWKEIELAELVQKQLAPYATPGRVVMSGPTVVLNALATEALSVIIHELVTNAAKYGALSVPQGRICVRCKRSETGSTDQQLGDLQLDWQESNGPVVVTPSRAGFGTTTIRELIEYELGGQADLVFASNGLICRIVIPFARVVASRE